MIKKTKNLSKLIFETTQTSPKKYSFSLVSRMQNTVLDIVSTLYSANDTIINLKVIADMDKTIAFMESKKKNPSCEFSKEKERKLFELKMSRELKYSERITKRKASEKMKRKYIILTMPMNVAK